MLALRARLEPLRPHLPAAAALAALVVFLFRHALVGGQVFYRRDLHLQWQAQVTAFVRAVAEGSWPVWNPWAGFGQPLWANPNNQVLYPFTWLHLILQPWTYYTCFVVAHFFFSAVGMYALGLRLGVSRGGSCVAAAVWVASGPFLSLVDLWNHLSAAAWLPWIFLAADRALASGRPSAALLCGGALAMPVLSGSPETALMAGLAVAGHALWSGVRRPSPFGSARRVATTMAVAVAFAVALSTAQWWPSLELIRGSPRLTESGSAGRTFWSVHPLVALQAFLPVFPDRLPLRSEVRATYSESREAFLPSLYLGISSLGLVLAGANRPRRRLWLFFLLLATAGVLLALGRHTPVYAAAASLVPLLKALRFPAKALVLTSFAWGMLAGLGFDAWRERTPSRAGRWTAAAALALGAAIAGGGCFVLRTHAEEWGSAILFRATSPRSFTEILAPTARGLAVASGFALVMLVLVGLRRVRAVPSVRLASVAGAVVLADLLSVHHRLDATAARELLTYRPPALAAIRPGPFMRTYVYDYFDAGKAPRYLGHMSAYLTATPQEDWPVPWLDALALRTALYPSVLGLWKIEGAYDLDRLDLYPLPLGMLTRALRQLEGTPFHRRLLRLGAVEYLVALHRQGFEDLTLEAVLPTLFVEPLFVFRVPDPLPRTYAVGAARPGETPLAELQTLVGPAFDPSREVVLRSREVNPRSLSSWGGSPAPPDPPAGAAAPTAPAFSGRSRIVEFRADRVRLESELSAPGFVVLVDAHDAGWRATVDGQPADVLRANVAFRAVAVPAGRHVVEYLYRPRSITWGLAVSGAALLAAVGVAAVETRRRRSPAEAA